MLRTNKTDTHTSRSQFGASRCALLGAFYLASIRLPLMAEVPALAVALGACSVVGNHGVRHRADKVRWQCQLDGGLWADYPLDICRFIETAWNVATEREASLDAIDDNYKMYIVDVKALVQMNIWSEQVRPVRRIIVTDE